MEEIFGNDELFNHTLKLGASRIAHVYTAEEIALMLGAFGAAIASIIYSFKHIKSSSCWGFKCKQQVDEVCIVPQPLRQSSEV
tara:strand:- start:2344 stop:2592 length:249 start_codon:yes stop_codon:yes gene_type:complete